MELSRPESRLRGLGKRGTADPAGGPVLDTPSHPPLSLSLATWRTYASGRVSAGLRGIDLRWARRFPMFIEIAELELHPIDFQEEFLPGAIDLGAEVRQLAPLRSQGPRAVGRRAPRQTPDVIQDIRLQGELATTSGAALCALPRPGGAECGPHVRFALPAAGNRRRARRAFGHSCRSRDRLLPGRRAACWKTLCASRYCWRSR